MKIRNWKASDKQEAESLKLFLDSKGVETGEIFTVNYDKRCFLPYRPIGKYQYENIENWIEEWFNEYFNSGYMKLVKK